MWIAFSLALIALGASLAGAADRAPPYRKAMETCGGLMLVAGLALVGAGIAHPR